MQEIPFWMFILTGVLFFILFLLFQIALLFEENEVTNILNFFKEKYNIIFSFFLFLLVGLLLILFVWYLIDPYFYNVLGI